MQLGQARAGTAARDWVELGVVYYMVAWAGTDNRRYRQMTCKSGREIDTQESGGAFSGVLLRGIGQIEQQRATPLLRRLLVQIPRFRRIVVMIVRASGANLARFGSTVVWVSGANHIEVLGVHVAERGGSRFNFSFFHPR